VSVSESATPAGTPKLKRRTKASISVFPDPVDGDSEKDRMEFDVTEDTDKEHTDT